VEEDGVEARVACRGDILPAGSLIDRAEQAARSAAEKRAPILRQRGDVGGAEVLADKAPATAVEAKSSAAATAEIDERRGDGQRARIGMRQADERHGAAAPVNQAGALVGEVDAADVGGQDGAAGPGAERRPSSSVLGELIAAAAGRGVERI